MCSSAFVRAVCIVAVVTLLSAARAQQPGAAGPAPVQPEQTRKPQDQPAESLFNDRLRKFKFDLEHAVVTADTAEAFLHRYGQSGSPRIIGAYPDDQTNALVVIGPPEAEQAIREHLAQLLVEAQGVGGTPLAIQLRQLQQRRKVFLAEMALLEIQKTEVTPSDQAAKAQQLADRLQMFEGQVQLLERQMEIVTKYLDRASRNPSADSSK